MATQVSYPGVYIEEFDAGAPIQGVGTSTAAFLGPASKGPLNIPEKITSWDAFLAAYGDNPMNVQDYLWYAVRGFFQNGGKVCYILRVSNAAYDSAPLVDFTNKDTLTVRARAAGDFSSDPIKATVADAHAQTTQLYQPTATIKSASGVTAQVNAADQAAQFRPGDRITLRQGSKTDTVPVLRVENDLIRLAGSLSNTYSGGTVRLANLRGGTDNTFRLEAGDKLTQGSVLKLTQGTKPPETVVVQSIITERISNTLTTYRVTTVQPVSQDFDMTQTVNAVSQEFTLTITQGSYTPPPYEFLSMEPSSPRYYAQVVNSDTTGRVLLLAVEPPNTTAVPDNRPKAQTVTLTRGAADNPGALTSADYENALRRLEVLDDASLIAAPGLTDPAIQTVIKEHCERMKDRFAILDGWRIAPPFGTGNGSVEEQRLGLDSPSGFAALYYPWLQVVSADGKDRPFMPSSGHVAGVIARTDSSRGVFKAPAGTEAIVSGALAVRQPLSDIDQGELNLKGINVIRVFRVGGAPVVWGARTTSNTTVWQYVNIRRLFIYLEKSIQKGIRWAVFEPNNQALWQKLKRTIRAFLVQQWRDGALFGPTPDDAFYIRIDEVLNPFEEQQLGRLHIEIGIRPAYPAEFIIVRMGIWPGGSETTEI